MTAKIDWYKEVLELEPNSKVFFPLARLLADAGQPNEALRALEKGLERHPEYLEARLFRIELLHAAGEKAACNSEIEKLSKMFASYAGFWKAWAACLVSEQGQEDAASLLRFLAAHFVSGPLQLHEVLNKGLDAMLKDGEIAPRQDIGGALADSMAESGASQEASAAKSPEEAFAHDAGGMLADLDAELEAVAAAQAGEPEARPEVEEDEATGALDEAALGAEELELPEAKAEPGLLPVSEALAGEAPIAAILEDELPAVEAGPAKASPEALDDLDGLGEEPGAPEAMPGLRAEAELEAALGPAADLAPDAAFDQAVPLEGIPEEDAARAAGAEPLDGAVAAIAERAAAFEMPEESLPESPIRDDALPVLEADANVDAPAPESLAAAEAEMVAGLELPEMEAAPAVEDASEEMDGADEPEERFTLRTRSMAEVLAEQGDLQGALDIYQELAAEATSADEAEDINRRIATLNGRLSMASASYGFKAEDDESAAKSKQKLIGMLEALAQRVDARANA